MSNKVLKTSIIIISTMLVLYGISNWQYWRIDLTQDNRYTLSQTSQDIIKQVGQPITIDVFLTGDFPEAFKKLQQETRQILEEYEALNHNIKFKFINPTEDGTAIETVAQQFNTQGMQPEQVQVRNNGKVTQEIFFPWAIASYAQKSVRIPLLKKKLGASPDELVSRSTQNLEYEFTNAFYKLLKPKSKRIAVLQGNQGLDDKYITDFFTTLRERYFIAPFPLDSIQNSPDKVIKALNTFDLIVAAKPTQPFTDAQKYALDQFTMQGGKSLWLLDMVAMETDSLYNEEGRAVTIGRNLNLNDMFFEYGVRINPVLTQDLYAAPIVLASGKNQNSQYSQLPWFYYPLVTPQESHPITTNLDNPIRFEYANAIDTLANGIKKTILAQSSTLSRKIGTPQVIRLDEVNTEPDPRTYAEGSQILSVLLEGTFTSAFENRIKPIEPKEIAFKNKAQHPTQMIVVADGDVIKNDLDKNGRPLTLGFDKFTFKEYGNKEFLLNAVNYLLDDNGLINIRSKNVELPALDPKRSIEERTYWQALMLGLPLALLTLFGVVFYLLRKRIYR